MKILSQNKKAFVDFSIEDKIEAGIMLVGWEVKSIKNNQASLKGSFIREKKGAFFLTGASISAWEGAGNVSKEELLRDRKLLLRSNQITNLITKVKEKGYAILPLDLYVNDAGMIKVTIGLGKGKKKFDKRDALKRKDMARRVDVERKKYNF